MILEFANGVFDVQLGDVVRCAGIHHSNCSDAVTYNTEYNWKVVGLNTDRRGLYSIAVTPLDSNCPFCLHSMMESYWKTDLDMDSRRAMKYYYFPASILNYYGELGASGHRCFYCGAESETMDKIDDRYICSDCKPTKTFVCIECGEVHDIRRRMKGLNLCRPCFDENEGTKYARAEDGDVYPVDQLVKVMHQRHTYWLTPAAAETQTFICVNCGNRHFARSRVTIGKRVFCSTCADDLYPICPHCHRRHAKRNCTRNRIGDYVCARCLSSLYVRCDVCGEWEYFSSFVIPEDDNRKYCSSCKANLGRCRDCGRYYVDSSKIHSIVVDLPYDNHHHKKVCVTCLENYEKCSCCDKYVRKDRRRGPDGNVYCSICMNQRFVPCSVCGEYVIRGTNTYGEDDNIICASCFADAEHGTKWCMDGSVDSYSHPFGVTNYSYKPTPILYPDKSGNGLFMGFELEVDGGNSPNTMADKINDLLGITYAKHDGSLGYNGIEFVSHPASMKWYEANKEKLASAMKRLRGAHFGSHTGGNCGLHIHVSAFPLKYETDNGIEKILYLQDKFWDNLFTFSRRKGSDINRWAKRIHVGRPEINSKPESGYISFLRDVKNDVRRRDRYRSVNLTNKHTVEFRFIRGTLNINTFMATIQLIHNICELALTKTTEEVFALTWDDIINYGDHAELKEYWETRTLPASRREAYDTDNTPVIDFVEEVPSAPLAVAA